MSCNLRYTVIDITKGGQTVGKPNMTADEALPAIKAHIDAFEDRGLQVKRHTPPMKGIFFDTLGGAFAALGGEMF